MAMIESNLISYKKSLKGGNMELSFAEKVETKKEIEIKDKKNVNSEEFYEELEYYEEFLSV